MYIEVQTLDQTKNIAEKLAKHVSKNDVILLNGDLGAGKTTFSQFFGKALGVKRNINSPTFNIIKSYKGKLPFHHMDCYRLENAEEDLGFDEYFEDEAVILIEWSQFIKPYLPEQHLTINIDVDNEYERTIQLVGTGKHYIQIKEEVEHELSVD